MANVDDDNLSELTDDDKLDGMEYPPERPLGVTDRTVDATIVRLRRKLGARAEDIQTVWGVGYRYSPGS